MRPAASHASAAVACVRAAARSNNLSAALVAACRVVVHMVIGLLVVGGAVVAAIAPACGRGELELVIAVRKAQVFEIRAALAQRPARSDRTIDRDHTVGRSLPPVGSAIGQQ